MKVSIAMTTCNGEKYLSTQLESFNTQKSLPDELVVCDDVSTDSTRKIIKEFASTVSFEVKLIKNQTRLGYVHNFAKVLSLCSGDVILLSDQDDEWFPEKIANTIKTFHENPKILLLQSDLVLTDEHLKSKGVTQFESMARLGFDERDFSIGCGMAIRRDFLSVLLPVPVMHMGGHDTWLGLLATALDARLLLRKPFQYYRRHTENASPSLFGTSNRFGQIKVLVANAFRDDCTVSWQSAAERFEYALDRIDSRRQELSRLGFSDRKVEEVRLGLRGEILLNRQRIAVVRTPRYRRLPRVVKFWGQGGYANFATWKSAVKDLMHP